MRHPQHQRNGTLRRLAPPIKKAGCGWREERRSPVVRALRKGRPKEESKATAPLTPSCKPKKEGNWGGQSSSKTGRKSDAREHRIHGKTGTCFAGPRKSKEQSVWKTKKRKLQATAGASRRNRRGRKRCTGLYGVREDKRRTDGRGEKFEKKKEKGWALV